MRRSSDRPQLRSGIQQALAQSADAAVGRAKALVRIGDRDTGRRSEKRYATPIVAERVPGGFLIPLPYGPGVDRLRNVVAAGHATIRAHGRRYSVVQPEVIPASASTPQLLLQRRCTYDSFGVENYLHVKAEPA